MLWNVKQVANYLSVSNSMVYKMVSNNVLPCVRICNNIRFRPETIESLVVENWNDMDEEVGKSFLANQDMNFAAQCLL